MDKYDYDAVSAHEEYRRDLVDYWEGINLTTKEQDTIAQIITPLLKQGQSVRKILSAHPEVEQCQKALNIRQIPRDNVVLKPQLILSK